MRERDGNTHEIPCGGRVELGSSWFYAPDEDWRTSTGACPRGLVADADHPRPDIVFGPAAWGRGAGPAAAAVLLGVEAAAFSPHADERAAVPASPFPGTVSVTARGREAGLADLDGAVAATLGDLLAMVRRRVPAGGACRTTTPGERAAAVLARFPGPRAR